MGRGISPVGRGLSPRFGGLVLSSGVKFDQQSVSRSMAGKWVLFWSVFYGVGEPLLRVLAFREGGFLDPLGIAAVLLAGPCWGASG